MANEFIINWETQARKGLLELCILNILATQRLYGYDIVRALSQAGSLTASEGTVYPLLARLRREGLIEATLEESSQGPARKYYQLSPQALPMLQRMNRLWDVVATSVEQSRSKRE